MRIAVLLTNPIQHEIPFLKSLSHHPDFKVDVIYYSQEGSENFDYFGLKKINYGIPMLLGYNFIMLNNISPFKGYKLRFISPGIIKALRNGNYNLILLYGYQSPTSLLAIIYAKIKKIPIIQRSEGESIQNISKLKKTIRQLIYPHIYKVFDGFTALCQANNNHYLEYGVKKNDIALVPQTVNDEFFSNPNLNRFEILRLQYNLDKDETLFIFGSKLRKEKSPLDAVKAFCMLPKHVKAKLIILSDGPERKICEDYVLSKKFIEKIIFTGYIPFEDMRDLFNLADVLMITSSETIGATLYQAVFSSLAIISSDKVPANKDLIHEEKNGLIYPYGDIKKLNDCLKYFINNKESISCMKNYSKQLSHNFTSEKSAQQFFEFIDNRFI